MAEQDDKGRREGEEHIPLEPSERPDIAPKKEERVKGEDVRSLIEEARTSAENCPNCGARMKAEAVVCTNCGWDLVRNKLIRPEIEADEIEEKTALATEGLINWKVGLALALAAWVGAMGVAAGATETDTLREVVRIGLYAPILAGLGFIAGVMTAKLLETGVGDYAALAARMALAVALAYLGHRLGMALDLPRPAPGLVGLLLAFGGYVATIFFTLSLTWTATLLLAGLHLVMWLLFRGLRWAIDWVEAGPAATGGN